MKECKGCVCSNCSKSPAQGNVYECKKNNCGSCSESIVFRLMYCPESQEKGDKDVFTW